MTVNPNNFIGVSNTLVGFAASDPAYPAYDPQGEHKYKMVDVAINEGYKPKDGEFIKTGVTWYSIKRRDWDALGVKKGDKIRVDDAKQSVREFTSHAGEKKLGITLEFGTVKVLESKRDTPAEVISDSPF